MAEIFYTLPIPFLNIIERKEIEKVDLKKSIKQKIDLTLVTFLGECRFDKDFGCEIWEYDFENIGSSNMNAWKDKVTKSITATLIKSEKRLDKIKVVVEIHAEEYTNKRVSDVTSIRKRLDLFVTGNLVKTNEPFQHTKPIYISPIAMD